MICFACIISAKKTYLKFLNTANQQIMNKSKLFPNQIAKQIKIVKICHIKPISYDLFNLMFFFVNFFVIINFFAIN